MYCLVVPRFSGRFIFRSCILSAPGRVLPDGVGDCHPQREARSIGRLAGEQIVRKSPSHPTMRVVQYTWAAATKGCRLLLVAHVNAGSTSAAFRLTRHKRATAFVGRTVALLRSSLVDVPSTSVVSPRRLQPVFCLTAHAQLCAVL